MPNVEWGVAHDLVTPAGTVLLNQPDGGTGRTYLIRPDGYQIVPTLRVTSDNKSQADGSVLHPRWKTGLVAALTVAYLVKEADSDEGTDYRNACDGELREMHEDLIEAINSIRTLPDGATDQRLIWTPSGSVGGSSLSRRMIDQCQVLNWPTPAFEDDGECRVTLAIETPYPYAISLNQDSVALDATVTNGGNCDFLPVVHVAGPFSAFTLASATAGMEVVYDSSLPGGAAVAGGHFLELDFFRGTAFLDGSSTDLIGGIDPTLTDFFPFVTGGNVVTISGAGATVLMNDAWA